MISLGACSLVFPVVPVGLSCPKPHNCKTDRVPDHVQHSISWLMRQQNHSHISAAIVLQAVHTTGLFHPMWTGHFYIFANAEAYLSHRLMCPAAIFTSTDKSTSDAFLNKQPQSVLYKHNDVNSPDTYHYHTIASTTVA